MQKCWNEKFVELKRFGGKRVLLVSYVTLCDVMLWYVMVWYGMACYVMDVMLWHVMVCYANISFNIDVSINIMCTIHAHSSAGRRPIVRKHTDNVGVS